MTGTGLVHEAFRLRADESPSAPALVAGGVAISYRELDERSDRVAAALRAAGARAESVAALLLGPDPAVVVAMLGCLKAGVAYAPIDPDYPAARLRTLIDDARPAVLVTAADTGPPAGDRPVVALTGAGEPVGPAGTAPLVRLRPDNAACVIYTSGSTGRPKGSVLTHAGLVNLASAAAARFGLARGDRFLQMASVSFSAFLEEVWPALLAGATVVLGGYRRALVSVPHLLDLLAAERITGFGITTAHWHELVAQMTVAGRRFPPSLRFVLMGSEVALPDRVKAWRGLGVPLVHVYGPTEFTATATYLHTAEHDPVDGRLPIGRPIPASDFRLLDESMRPVPDGRTGEIYLGGTPLARGYLRRPGETADRFVPDPYGAPGARLYRTGDLGRRLPGGDFEFLGRVDGQVKLRGHRVEPAEVERELTAHPRVRSAVAAVREDRPGDRRLVGYLVPAAADDPPTRAELTAFLAERLPDHLVPAVLVTLPELPLTPNGKLDRSALPAPGGDRPDVGPFVAPDGPLERRICELAGSAVGVHPVGAADDLFALGADSLTVARLLGDLRREFHVTLAARDVFAARTPRATAALVAAAPADESAAGGPDDPAGWRRRRALMSRALAGAGGPPGSAPLSVGQHGLWVLEQLAPGIGLYHVPWRVGLVGPLDTEALERALTAVVARHEVLRSRFATVDGTPVQAPMPVEPVRLTVHDLRGLSAAERARRGAELSVAEAAAPFDLATGPLFRAVLFRIDDEDHELLCTAHHLVFDGGSVRVLLDELARHYADPAPAAEPFADAVQYADFAVWQRERLHGPRLAELVGYWRDQLAGAPALLPLPTDRPRRAGHEFAGANLRLALPAELRDAVAASGRRAGGTPFMAGLAAFGALLHRLSGATDICVGIPAANRALPAFERLLGYFVSMLVIRLDLSGDPSLAEVLRRTRDACLAAYEHQELPFDRLVEHLNPERVDGANPVFQVVFSADDAPGLGATLPGLLVRPGAEVPTGRARFDLAWLMEDHGDDWIAGVDYSTDLFDAATVATMVEQYQAMLRAFAGEPHRQLSTVDLESPAPAPPLSGSVEDVLRGMWAEAFGQDEIGPDDDFFELGGYSMLAAQMCVRIRELYQVDLPLRSFFETPTVAELAEKIRAGAGTDADDVVPVRRERPVEELLAEIEGLSDEQVASAVAAMDAER